MPGRLEGDVRRDIDEIVAGGRRGPGDPPGSVIESLGVHLPAGVASTREVLAGCHRLPWVQRHSACRIERLTGIRSRRLAAEDETALDMAGRAMVRCFATSRYRPADVDLLVWCGISRFDRPDRMAYEPSFSLLLADHFGFDRALTFDLSNGCAGMFTAIHVVDALIAAGIIRTGMVVSGEHITDLLRTAQKEVTGFSDPRFACLTLGDAAAAVIVHPGAGEGAGFHDIALSTAGLYSECCVAKPSQEPHGGIVMWTDSARLFDAATRQQAAEIARALGTLRWGRKELDHIIIHQTSRVAIDRLQRVNDLLGDEVLHDGNVVDNLAERGNTATTSHFVALWDRIRDGRVRSGQRVLFAVQGSGLTTGTASCTFDDLPDRLRGASFNGHDNPPASWSRHARAVLRADAARVRIESCGIAGGVTGPDAGLGLALEAMDRCLAGSRWARDEIDLLVFAGVHRDEFIGEPAVAARIAGRAGLNPAGFSAATGRGTLAFDVFNGSIGFLQACAIAAGMIRSRRIRSAMVVASEIENNAAIAHAERSGIAEIGSAVILDRSPDGRTGFGHALFTSSTGHAGAYSSWLDPGQGRPRMRYRREVDLEGAWLECIPRTVEELLRIEGLEMDDVALFLPPQVSRGFGPRLAGELNVGRDRMIDVVEDGHSLFSSSLAWSFLRARDARSMAPGRIGVIVNAGSGVQIGATTYRF